jgi:hypothetical protein
LDSDKSIELLNKGTIKGVEGAVVQSTTDESVKASLEAEKYTIAKNTGANLERESKERGGADIQAAEEYYKSLGFEGKSAYTQISKDYMDKEGFFASDDYRNKYSKGKLQETLETGAERYNILEQSSQAKGEGTSPELQSQKALISAIEKLAGEITGGGQIGVVIQRLADALKI